MKKTIIFHTIVVFAGFGAFHLIAQDRRTEMPPSASQTQTQYLKPEEKREQKKNLVVKEMNADAGGKRKWLDHITVWDENGYKLEEIEYAVYGQRERVTFEYDATGKCIFCLLLPDPTLT